MITSCTCSGRTFARLSASAIATAPSFGAVSSARPPRNFPIGVRRAERMNASICCTRSVVRGAAGAYHALGEFYTDTAPNHMAEPLLVAENLTKDYGTF